jgi:O-antigen/teichoic acid export membrane protein
MSEAVSALIAERQGQRSAVGLADPGLDPLAPITPATAVPGSDLGEPARALPGHVAKKVIGGTSTLGAGMLIERGTGFLANILAARFGGTQTFGAYSLAISTANQISTYAAGQIGSTAARFSGKYQYGTDGYSTLARALAIVSLVSAAAAATGLWLGAAPLAHLLGKVALTGLLTWAAVSAAGIVLLECARGFFVGQRRLAALLLLSVIVGGGMVTLLPAAARTHSPTRMIVLQGCITSSAVLVCLLLARPLRLIPGAVEGSGTNGVAAPGLGTMLREVWSFGAVQLAGLVGSSLAGWWLTTLVVREDTTLAQMGFFAIASQMRNLAGIAPGLLTEGSYAVMAEPEGEAERTPHRVMALCTYASISVALMLAAIGMVVVPWALTLMYGKTYAPAALTVAIGLAIAVVHMGNAPAAARLTIVSIKSTGVINTVWAAFVAAAASLFLIYGGGAWQAMAIYFAGHVLSSTLVLMTLRRKDHVPAGMSLLFGFATASAAVLALLAYLRAVRPGVALPITAMMAVVACVALLGLYLFGRRYGWMPSASAMRRLMESVRARLPWRPRYV